MIVKKIARKSLLFLIAFSLLTPNLFLGLLAKPTQAVPLTEAFLRLDRMKASTTTGGTVCLKANTTASSDAHVEVTFPSGFTVNATAGNWTVTTTNLPLGATAMPGVSTAEDVTGQVVRFPISDIANDSTLYCFNFTGTSTLTTSTAGTDLVGTITTTTSADAEIDTTDYATAVVADDQVVITGTVPPTFTFTLNQNITEFPGNLSSGSVVDTSADQIVITASTNASNGWVAWLKSANAGLDSTITGESIDSAGSVNDSCTTVTSGSDFYQLDVAAAQGGTGGGTATADAEYLCTGDDGGTFTTQFEEIGSGDGTTNGDTLTLTAQVAITAIKAAGNDYTDTWDIVGAANF